MTDPFLKKFGDPATSGMQTDIAKATTNTVADIAKGKLVTVNIAGAGNVSIPHFLGRTPKAYLVAKADAVVNFAVVSEGTDRSVLQASAPGNVTLYIF